MVGVLAIAVLGALAYVSLKMVRSFMLNLKHAKKMGLPYVIGRKFLLCELCAMKLVYADNRSLPSCRIRLDGTRRDHRDTAQQDPLCERVVMATVRLPPSFRFRSSQE